MIRSMTGYGAGSHTAGAVSIGVELRTVNSRHLKLHLRLPAGTTAWEEPLRKHLAARLQRGHVDALVRIEAADDVHGRSMMIDGARAAEYVAGLRQLKESLGLAGDVEVAHLAGWDRWWTEASAPRAEDVDLESVEPAVSAALDELVDMRAREGRRLEVDLRARLARLAAGLDEVGELAPLRLDRERERLRRVVEELVAGHPLDEDRLVREIGLVADRWDVTEELVRTRSHLQGIEELLDTPGDEPVGKRLGFFSQELLREINTIGSKANDAGIARIVVNMKNELESVREQIENVE